MASVSDVPTIVGGTSPGRRWASLVIALLAGTAVWFALEDSGTPGVLSVEKGFTHLEPPLPLPDFELVSATDARVTQADLSGGWTLVSLGFTSCPDVCPNTLAALSGALAGLSASGVDARVLFVSVDPERDALERLASYAAHFGPGVEGATGTHDALRRLVEPLGLFYRHVPGADAAAYTVEHSTTVLVVNPRGEVEALLSGDQLSVDGVERALRVLGGASA